MADIAISGESNFPDLVPTKKGRSRKALKPSNDSNILPVPVSQSSPMKKASETIIESTGKENEKKKTKKKAVKGAKVQESDFEKEFEEMQKKLEQMTLEKEKTEEMLKEKEEALRLREEELETRGREQEKLQMEIKKLGKMKEFKPTVNFPLVQVPKEKEQGKKDKKKACPERKKPSPPYALWLKDQWTEVKKENPDAEFKEISTMLAAKWKTVTAEEKKPYEEKYQAEKEAYLKIVGAEKRENEAMKLLEEEQKQRTAMELLEQYMQFKEETENDKKKKTKKEKDPLKPKHPVTAFFLFMNGRRADLVADKKNVLEVGKITGEEWKSMSEKEKAPYEEMAKKNKEIYLKQMEAYKKKKDEEAASLQKEEEELSKLQKQEALQLLKKKEKTENLIKKTKEDRQKKQKAEKKIVDPNKPKRPASSFFLFSKEARKTISEERPGINNSTLNALISVKWKEISQEEKQLWNEKAGGAMEAYKKELEEYNKTLTAAEESSSSCSGQ
ncbi:High mobility group B protein 6 [Heracleum sosnowskyi]|uniref:High mobility group B protein 6 n=1 Tax=Heracleum sosnowskyi TaxID=360622 RepID=A0AAD8I3X6_9APIA|nr:High mobility group B protein 6 [Heracleum sosnowskyi]